MPAARKRRFHSGVYGPDRAGCPPATASSAEAAPAGPPVTDPAASTADLVGVCRGDIGISIHAVLRQGGGDIAPPGLGRITGCYHFSHVLSSLRIQFLSTETAPSDHCVPQPQSPAIFPLLGAAEPSLVSALYKPEGFRQSLHFGPDIAG